MSKFNQKKILVDLTLNEENCLAYVLDTKTKLATMALTTFFNENKFYGDNSKNLCAIAISLIKSGDAKFVANLACFARKEMYLRSVSHVLCVLLAKYENGKQYVSQVVQNIVQRADDITEIMSCYIDVFGKPLPNSLKRAIAKAMNKFDAYQFAKYNNQNKEFNFKDVLRLTHAKGETEAQNEIFQGIINDSLPIPYTWETELSKKGNTTEVWEELIASEKLGYLALLRNLNNILNANPKNLQKALDTLTNATLIKKSKIFPFQFFSAYKNIKENSNFSSKIFDALETAIEISVQNIPKLEGKSLIAIDVSASMTSGLSARSKTRCSDIACIFGSIASHICQDSIVLSFDDNLYKNNFSNKSGIISNALAIDFSGGGTYCHLPIEYILKKHIKVDRIIMISDFVCNYNFGSVSQNGTESQKAFSNYKSKVNPKVILHAIDLQGSGTSELKPNGINILAGWSENVFKFIQYYENGVSSFVKIIEEYQID